MKVLYVYPQFSVRSSGGSIVCKRNYEALCQYYGECNVYSYSLHRDENKSRFAMFCDDLFALGWGYTVRDKNTIVHNIRSNGIELVFVDSSLFGGLIRYVKKRTGVKSVVFFHNVEFDFVKSLVKTNKSILFFYRVPLAFINEQRAIRYSDMIITLNKKDAERLGSLYGRSADYIIPVTFEDKTVNSNISLHYSEPLRLLFFGSNFPPNVEAVDILVRDILPYVNATLTVAGSGMDQLINRYPPVGNIVIRGFVDDVEDLYLSSDIVVMPIVSGAGMKVKTAEAMMYGKNMIATTIALEGYEVEGTEGIFRCDSPKDFVQRINSFDRRLPRFNSRIRNLFLNKYSNDASYRVFTKVFNDLA